MSSLREQIHNNMDLKATEELLELWRNNDRAEWSDDAFEIIKEILKERGVETPEQNKPIYEHQEKEQQAEDDFSAQELHIIDDETPPAFYDPFDVLRITKQIDWMAKAMVAFVILYNIFNFPTTLQVLQSYFPGNSDSVFTYIIAIPIMVLNAAISVVVIYFPLKALAHILRVLMEMEFRSRKVLPSNPLVE